MTKAAKVTEVIDAEPEEIPGLQAALADERRSADALASARARAEAIEMDWEDAKNAKAVLVHRSAAGEPVDPRDIVAADAQIAELLEQIGTFPQVLHVAERDLAEAQSAVVGVLRGELSRRRRQAQADLDAAWQHLREAARARNEAAEELRRATAAVELPSDAVRSRFAAEVRRAS